jgi:hypothetical protein
MAGQISIWSVLWLKYVENGRWPAVVSDSASHPPVCLSFLQKSKPILSSAETLASSCMVITVHVVKGRQHTYSLHIRCLSRRDGVWDRLSTLKVTNLNASITEMNLTAQYTFQSSDRWVVDGVLYTCIARASYRHYVSQEVRPAILVRK